MANTTNTNLTNEYGPEKRIAYRIIDEQGNYVAQYSKTSADMVVVDKFGDITGDNVQAVLQELNTKVGSAGKVDDVVAGTKDGTGNKSLVADDKVAYITPAAIGAATQTAVDEINGKIPTAASKTNQLADKSYVGSTIDGKLEDYATKEELQEGLAGKPKTMVFNNYEEFVNIVNNSAITDLKAGDNVYIKTLDVPDLWVSATPSGTKVTYKYTSDDAIVQALKTGTIQVGYFTFSALEANKVDLSDYQTKNDNTLATTAKTVVGAINEVDTNVKNIVNGTTKVGSAASADNAAKLNNQAASYYLNYNNFTNKPQINTTNTTSQATVNKEISGTINLHKIASTGVFSDLLNSPVIVSSAKDLNSLTEPGLYELNGSIENSPVSGGLTSKFWVMVQKYTFESQVMLSQVIITSDYLYSRTGDESGSVMGWSGWRYLYFDNIATKTEIPTIPDITVATTGSGIVSNVAVDSTNKHKLNVTKRALTNADLPSSGATAGTYTKVTINSKGVVTGGTTLANTDLPNSGVTAGTYAKVTVNSKGVVTIGASLTNADLPNSGVSAGAYTAVEVNAKGVVTKGGTSIEFGTAANNVPSANLIVGGLFFELQT